MAPFNAARHPSLQKHSRKLPPAVAAGGARTGLCRAPVHACQSRRSRSSGPGLNGVSLARTENAGARSAASRVVRPDANARWLPSEPHGAPHFAHARQHSALAAVCAKQSATSVPTMSPRAYVRDDFISFQPGLRSSAQLSCQAGVNRARPLSRQQRIFSELQSRRASINANPRTAAQLLNWLRPDPPPPRPRFPDPRTAFRVRIAFVSKSLLVGNCQSLNQKACSGCCN